MAMSAGCPQPRRPRHGAQPGPGHGVRCPPERSRGRQWRWRGVVYAISRGQEVRKSPPKGWRSTMWWKSCARRLPQ
ncbi:hypothetical protein ACTMU2_00920 [Cupriavidus basilensis]